MILIGQFDSPFCRRVGIALKLYDVAFEHRPWSTFGDADKLSAFNPLLRVPTLVLDDGTVLVESQGILAHLDETAACGTSLMPASTADRMALRRVTGLASGISDKAVALFYEQVLHDTPSQLFMDRCRSQISGALAALEAEGSALKSDYWFEDRITHADIALGTTIEHLSACHPALFDAGAYPTLHRQAERLSALPVFQDIYQPFIPPTKE
ncbi:glutathione S-transferase family protein [Pseudohoeflea suaedae]|uniref:Glutathione S-transferase family protein n=1 Tax=Pseudohoeflea suaedae TaxID=877384 RepID=A0A4R5PQF6_9HYPH|nr:glutathione S-transferase family protein [Pseudohoeflea suaedae]TDH39279.1 glutathione S-transferase family protein [Pseudohoeflea suaedae]